MPGCPSCCLIVLAASSGIGTPPVLMVRVATGGASLGTPEPCFFAPTNGATISLWSAYRLSTPASHRKTVQGPTQSPSQRPFDAPKEAYDTAAELTSYNTNMMKVNKAL